MSLEWREWECESDEEMEREVMEVEEEEKTVGAEETKQEGGTGE